MVAVSSNSRPLRAEVASLEIAQTTSIENGRITNAMHESCETTHTNAPDGEAAQVNVVTTSTVYSTKNFEISERHGVKLVKPTSRSVSCKAVNLIDAFIYSPSIPDSIKDDLTQPCVLGVDEAGRGPVLGPMVYGVCYCPLSKYEELKALGFADSKTLKEDERDRLFDILEKNADIARSSIHALSPQSISAGMLRGQKYNLNEMAHQSTIGLIRGVLELGINITEIYVDTVGPPSSYQAKLCRMFPGIDITVAKKADSTYPIVSAASIVAKVTRDAILKNWTFAEPKLSETIGQAFGSGYPSDPNTVRWLNENIDPVFGYPSIIRFSWSTTATILEKNAASVEWPDTETKGAQKSLAKFVKEPAKNSKLMQTFGLKAVSDFA